LENDVPDCGKMLLNAKAWSRIKDKTSSEVTLLISELKRSMNEKGGFTGGDSW